MRKLIVVGLVGVVFLTANFLVVASWLQDRGVSPTFWTAANRMQQAVGFRDTRLVSARRAGYNLSPGCCMISG
jgi:hypothetical protein